MIVDQKLFERDGKTVLRNTIDCGAAIERAREVTQDGGRAKNLIPMGYIPPEMWLFDPWLIEATKAQRAGDKAEFNRLLMKFFEVHPKFAVGRDRMRKYVNGVTL